MFYLDPFARIINICCSDGGPSPPPGWPDSGLFIGTRTAFVTRTQSRSLSYTAPGSASGECVTFDYACQQTQPLHPISAGTQVNIYFYAPYNDSPQIIKTFPTTFIETSFFPANDYEIDSQGNGVLYVIYASGQPSALWLHTWDILFNKPQGCFSFRAQGQVCKSQAAVADMQSLLNIPYYGTTPVTGGTWYWQNPVVTLQGGGFPATFLNVEYETAFIGN